MQETITGCGFNIFLGFPKFLFKIIQRNFSFQEHAKNACTKTLPCGHPCGGIRGEETCLPCLHGCQGRDLLKQDADDMCMICFTEALAAAPAVQVIILT